jgi:hypothetical protein
MTISTENLLLIVSLLLALATGGCCGLVWYNWRRQRNRRLAFLIVGALVTVGLLALSEPAAAVKTIAFLACFFLPVLFALTEADNRESVDREQFINRVIDQAKHGEL